MYKNLFPGLSTTRMLFYAIYVVFEHSVRFYSSIWSARHFVVRCPHSQSSQISSFLERTPSFMQTIFFGQFPFLNPPLTILLQIQRNLLSFQSPHTLFHPPYGGRHVQRPLCPVLLFGTLYPWPPLWQVSTCEIIETDWWVIYGWLIYGW